MTKFEYLIPEAKHRWLACADKLKTGVDDVYLFGMRSGIVTFITFNSRKTEIILELKSGKWI